VTQIDAVEDDRIAVIVLPIVRRRLKTGELGEGRPPIHMGPHAHIDRAGLDWPGHQGSPGASTAESEVRIGMRPVMKEARPAVQLAWP
jgi:hypothetical protein